MLGVEPARGANLWSTWSAPKRPANEFLAGARYVLVPRKTTSLNGPMNSTTRLYGGYLEEHFRWAAEYWCWILLMRSNPDLPASISQGQI